MQHEQQAMGCSAFDLRDLYRSAVAAGFTADVHHFRCLASLYQNQWVYEVSLRYLRADMRVLDWGCGNGHFSYFLLSRNVKTIGFSFDAAPAHLARDPRYAHVVGTPEEPVRLPFDDRAFDLVFSIGVLEHVGDTGGDERASLAEIRRILRPGGHFLCFHLPNRFGWVEPLGRVLGAIGYSHPRRYRVRDIVAMVDAAGLQLVERGRYNFLPRNELRSLPPMLRDGEIGVRVINALDAGLEWILPILTQNHYFVAHKASA
jgi:SAM-dependent methyltransferase